METSYDRVHFNGDSLYRGSLLWGFVSEGFVIMRDRTKQGSL